ncbi:Inner membrane ABC transporter permease protein YdcV [Roseovarius litorisediminis]|uniref:Inner membrane ABC transporter permease protein YdcV n=1 Tax=Roseovarius litorisediminis TaxID=1312363 RepID=A0A1Y5TP86_9RHOB|nr:ABC transporter permease [Roseovarius litorisediminis]SLN66519.1 Inner membrane ABC transporter permease protein YdcV [Roseovarius litorisediminis]
MRVWSLLKFYTVLVYTFMFAPIMVVLVLAFNSSQFGGFPIEGFSLRWFYALAENDAIIRALRTSVMLGLLTALIATTLGILASVALVRYQFRGKQWITTFLISPVLVPETVLAVGLLIFMRWLHMPRSFALLLIGHSIIALPFVVLVVQARLIGIRKDYEEAARSLGASPLQTFFQITLPLLLPAVFAGALFAFTISFDNITATIFWRPAGMETVPTQIFGMLRNSVSPEINALGFVMICITVGVPLLAGGLARYFSRKKI